MSSEVLIPQAALTGRDRCDSTAVADDVAVSVRNLGKMSMTSTTALKDRLKQAFCG